MTMPTRCLFFVNLYEDPDGPEPYSSAHVDLTAAVDELAETFPVGFGRYMTTIELAVADGVPVSRVLDLTTLASHQRAMAAGMLLP